MSDHSNKSIYYALSANASIAVAKGIAAAVTGSGSMLAETVHSTADCGNQLLLLLGIRKAKRPPSYDFPLGHGKESYFWSFIVALMLFSVGGMFSIYEGLHKLSTHEPLDMPWVALGVLAFSVAAEGGSLFGCIKEINRTRGDQTLWQWFKDTRRSELIVVFGEDLAALIGLSLAMLAVIATMVTGNPVYDAMGSIAIGSLLVVISIMVGREIKDLLVGQGVEPEIKKNMESWLESSPHVNRVYNIITQQLGPDVMVAVKARMNEIQDVTQLIDAINETEKSFKAAFPQVVWLFFEPDNKD